MKNKKFEEITILFLVLVMFSFFYFYNDNPTITGLSHKPSHDPGGGGSGGGSEAGAVGGVQKIVGIYPQFPLDEQIIKNGNYEFLVKVTYGGSPTSDAEVNLNSSLFGKAKAEYSGGITGIYKANITINDVKKGKYSITYKAEDKETEVFSIFVLIDPELRIETELKNTYQKGEIIKFKGIVKDFSGNPQQDANIIIKVYSKGILFEEKTLTDTSGEFSAEYIISQADPKGNWNITIETKDKYGNYGIKSFLPEIKSSSTANYVINFISPLADSIFKRGESLPVVVELREKDNLVEKASVRLITPLKEKILLKEIDKGIYSTNYIISSKAPLGNVRLKVEADKEIKEGLIKLGGDSISIEISPLEISFSVVSPDGDTAYTNSKLKFLVKLFYSDGSLVKGANLKAGLSNGKQINLLEKKPGVYSGDYLVSYEDLGALDIKIVSEDINKNIGTTSLIVYVRQRSFIENVLFNIYENTIRKFWWAFLTILIATIIFYRRNWEIKYLNFMLSKAKNKLIYLSDLEVDVERKYYKEGSITRNEFRSLIKDFEKKSAKERFKERILTEKLKRA